MILHYNIDAVSRYLLFVIAPNWIAHGLRDSMVGGVFCLVICIAVVITEVRGIGGFRNCRCNFLCFAYCLCIAFLFFFTILYLCLGTWQRYRTSIPKKLCIFLSQLQHYANMFLDRQFMIHGGIGQKIIQDLCHLIWWVIPL